LAYFTHLKCQKRIGDDDVGEGLEIKRFYKKTKKFVLIFWVKITPLIRFIHLIMQEYDSKCLKMYLLKYFSANHQTQ
jgi:hypothetical protein